MPTYICQLSWTEQAMRSLKDAPKRREAAHDIAKKAGVTIKQIFMTMGDHDLLTILEAPSADNVAKWALGLGTRGNVRTNTIRAWTEAEYMKLIGEVP